MIELPNNLISSSVMTTSQLFMDFLNPIALVIGFIVFVLIMSFMVDIIKQINKRQKKRWYNI